MKKYWKRGILAGILLLINAALIIGNPVLTGKIVDEVIVNKRDDLLMPILAAMIALTIIRTVSRYTYQILFESMGQDTVFRLREEMYNKLQELDFDYFNHTRVGDIMSRMTGDIDAIRHFTSWVTYNIIECVAWFTIAIIFMGTISFKLALALFIVIPLIFILTKKMSSQAREIFLGIRESFSRLNSMVEENISGNRVVRAFSREEYEIEKFNEHNGDFRKRNLESAKVSRKYLPWLDGFAGSMNLITLILGGIFTIQGEMTIGELVTFNGFLWMINMPMRMSGWLVNDAQRFSAACKKIRVMLSTQPAIPVEKTEEEAKLRGHVEFKNVGFHFADDPDTEILSDISFKVKPGEKVGILGETGSGKTTLVNLIARFYDPTTGKVLLDGIDARDWPVRKIREQISMVMQDVFLFSDTIEDNIAFGNPYVDRRFIRKVAEIADANGFIEAMPEGYATIVGERGVGLSGGQKQRVSLARALAQDPSILILDDTTSAVDMETESKIQKELGKITTKKTTFIIAHRISSVREADLILVLQHGRIVERGTHQELIEKQGEYYTIYQKQLGIEGR